MKRWPVLLAVAAVLGLVSGPAALESVAASEPPIEWHVLPIAFVGSAVALVAVLGFQVFLRSGHALRRGWSLFLLGAVYFVASGVSAVVAALLGSRMAAHSFMFLAVGAGLLLGLALAKAFFGRRLSNAPETGAGS